MTDLPVTFCPVGRISGDPQVSLSNDSLARTRARARANVTQPRRHERAYVYTRVQTLGIDCSAVGGLRFMSSEPRPE